jgi:hypothetical protein
LYTKHGNVETKDCQNCFSQCDECATELEFQNYLKVLLATFIFLRLLIIAQLFLDWLEIFSAKREDR